MNKQVTYWNGDPYFINSADFMIGEKEYSGERITAITQLNGKILMFTANHTFQLRPLRWYERLKLWIQKKF